MRWAQCVVRTALAAGSGGALAAANPPWGLTWLLPLGVAGLVLSVRGVRLRWAAPLGYACGAVYLLVLISWMRVVGTDAWLLVSLTVALFYAALGVALAAGTRLRASPFWVACLWVGTETALSKWPLGGFPWGRLVFATVETPFAAWLPWIGSAGVTFLVALAGGTVAWGLARIRSQTRSTMAGAIAVGLLVTFPVLVTPRSLTASWQRNAESISVAAVQGDVPGAGTQLVPNFEEVTQRHARATTDLARRVRAGTAVQPDLVVWPENSTAVDPFANLETHTAISEAVRAVRAPTLVGAIVDGERPDVVMNQGIVWQPDGTAVERYTKRHPVPFGEYLPFRGMFSGYDIGRLALIPRDMLPGTRTSPLRVAGALVADAICYDVAFDDVITDQVRAGAQMVTVQTSNATFTGTTQLAQQFAMSRLRAMESGRTVVVASVNGISGIVGPDGTVVEASEPQQVAVLEAQIALVDELTPAMRLGRWPAAGASALGALGLLVATLRAGRWGRRLPSTSCMSARHNGQP